MHGEAPPRWHDAAVDPMRRLRLGVTGLAAVIVLGSLGYLALGFAPLDAVYQTVTTVSTVGFREVQPLDAGGQAFTIGVILLGVGTAFYTLSGVVAAVVEGQVAESLGRRKMERRISRRSGHVIVCGYGRVGRTLVQHLAGAGREVVVIDVDPARLAGVPHEAVLGDAADDDVLRAAGVQRATALVAALSSDADNLVLTLSARALRPELFIVSRARTDGAEQKLRLAGADRVVNPQLIGGARMAAFVSSPHVAEFLDVVMHDGTLEFRLAEVPVPDGSGLAGRSLRASHIRDRTGALVLALRSADGAFTTNPSPDTAIRAGDLLIAIGTADQLRALGAAAAPGGG
jgi:voltage-gated potassium channel